MTQFVNECAPRSVNGCVSGEPVKRERVLVIGGGVSGLAAAIRLAHHGVSVTLMERATFPREKICGCCLGAAGVAALDSIGVGRGVRERGVATTSFVGYLQTGPNDASCSSPIRLPIRPGVAISRSVLDAYLMRCAINVGVEVRQPHEAQVIDTDGGVVTLRHRRIGETWTTTDEYSMVVVATGLTGVFQGKAPLVSSESETQIKTSASHRGNTANKRWDLPWIDPPHGPLGLATHLPGDHPLARQWQLDDGEIQMICGDDGYVGLVRLPDGSIDIAAALVSRARPSSNLNRGTSNRPATDGAGTSRLANDELRSSGQSNGRSNVASPWRRIAALLRSHPDWRSPSGYAASLDEWLERDAQWMSAPPLRRVRQVGRGRVVAIGDCARYVEPLTGEGMTWGIESGIAVADLWNEFPKSGESGIEFADRWNDRLASLQPKRRVICGGVTGALRSRHVRRWTQFGLTRFSWLARPLTRGLASGPRFDSTGVPPGG